MVFNVIKAKLTAIPNLSKDSQKMFTSIPLFLCFLNLLFLHGFRGLL